MGRLTAHGPDTALERSAHGYSERTLLPRHEGGTVFPSLRTRTLPFQEVRFHA